MPYCSKCGSLIEDSQLKQDIIEGRINPDDILQQINKTPKEDVEKYFLSMEENNFPVVELSTKVKI